jgi:ElaB/YqjD/DUF883 family membrane-anchored ribosome-binding protein
MKQRYLVTTPFLIVALVAACQSGGNRPAEAANTQERSASQRSSSQSTQTAPAADDFAYAQKDEFIEDMQGALAHIQNEVDRLTDDVEAAHGAAKAEAEAKVQALREKATRVSQRLEKAKNTTEATWDDVRGGIQKSFGELENSFQQTRQWLSDQLEY